MNRHDILKAACQLLLLIGDLLDGSSPASRRTMDEYFDTLERIASGHERLCPVDLQALLQEVSHGHISISISRHRYIDRSSKRVLFVLRRDMVLYRRLKHGLVDGVERCVEEERAARL